MKIVMLSDFETQSGGAAICASRLADAFLGCGQHVTRIVSYPDGQKHDWETIPLAPSLLAWGALRALPLSLGQLYAVPELRRRFARLLQTIKPDVVNVHNLHGASNNGWSLGLLRVCQVYAPVVWTLHDMWSITGRCAFSFDCEKYLKGCDVACPTPHEYPPLPAKKIASSWRARARFFQESHRLTAVAPSTWLAKLAQQGFWRGRCVETISYSLPLDIYMHIEKQIARQALGLEIRGPVLLLAGVSLADRRKGATLADEAIRKISTRPLTLLTLGMDHPQIDIPGVSVKHLGYVDHERTKALVYNAADIFVHPALADNLPNVVMEAIACGTPVIAFNVGGLPELVRTGKTGWLVPETNAELLARFLEMALEEITTGETLNHTCREIARAEFPQELQASRYLDLFQTLN